MARPFLFLFLLLLISPVSKAFANSVVVLPFTATKDTSKYGWIGESNADSISDILSRNRIFILDREDRLRAYRTLGIREGAPWTLATSLKVALELDAGFTVLGSFAVDEANPVADSRIVLSAAVMDVAKWRKLSELRVEGRLADLCLLETRLAYLVLKAMGREEPSESEADFLARFPAVRLDARENYIRGLLADAEESRHRYFTQAARLDENYRAPAFQLGLLHWQKRDCRQAATWLRKALEPDHPRREAQFMLGVCETRLGRYADAEAQFRSLYNTQPIPEFANNLAVVLARQRKEGVLDLLTFAAEQDPEDPDYRFNLGHALWLRERYDDAADRFREVLDLVAEDPEATRMLGRCLQREASRPAKAAAESLNRLKEDFTDSGIPPEPAIPQAAATP